MSLIEHIRHSRGYGIHSPFLYGVIRGAFMKRDIIGDRNDLFEALIKIGLQRKGAVELQNYFSFCTFATWSIDSFPQEAICDKALLIASDNCPDNVIDGLTENVGNKKLTLCLLRSDRKERKEFVRRLVDRHDSMSIENRYFTMLFYNELRPKQHIKL